MILPRVIADERERQSGVPERLSKLDVRVYYSQLPVADYVVNPEIAAERKSLGDFVSSVYDGRLFAQASSLASSFRKPYIIVEGDVTKVGGMVKNLASYYGAIASVTLAYDLRLMHTANPDETALALAALSRTAGPSPSAGDRPSSSEEQGRGPAAALLRLVATRGWGRSWRRGCSAVMAPPET